jgi:hypothetical protein
MRLIDLKTKEEAAPSKLSHAHIVLQVVLTRFRMMMNPGYPYEDVLRQYYNQTNLIMCSYLPQFKAFNVTSGASKPHRFFFVRWI